MISKILTKLVIKNVNIIVTFRNLDDHVTGNERMTLQLQKPKNLWSIFSIINKAPSSKIWESEKNIKSTQFQILEKTPWEITKHIRKKSDASNWKEPEMKEPEWDEPEWYNEEQEEPFPDYEQTKI